MTAAKRSKILSNCAISRENYSMAGIGQKARLPPSLTRPVQALDATPDLASTSVPCSGLQVKETLGLGEAKAERAAERATGHPHHSHTGVGTTAERPGTGYTGGAAGGPGYTGAAVSGPASTLLPHCSEPSRCCLEQSRLLRLLVLKKYGVEQRRVEKHPPQTQAWGADWGANCPRTRPLASRPPLLPTPPLALRTHPSLPQGTEGTYGERAYGTEGYETRTATVDVPVVQQVVGGAVDALLRSCDFKLSLSCWKVLEQPAIPARSLARQQEGTCCLLPPAPITAHSLCRPPPPRPPPLRLRVARLQCAGKSSSPRQAIRSVEHGLACMYAGL